MVAMTRWFLLAAALAMPAVGWLTQSGMLGGDVGAESRLFPTLLIPAGYAFGIWGLIFLLEVVFAVWQIRAGRIGDPGWSRLRAWASVGFVLTAVWTPVFIHHVHVGAVLVIWGALAAVLGAALQAARGDGDSAAGWTVARVALALHAGWLSLAAFVNTAQLALALGWTTEATQWPVSAGLWVAAAVLLLSVQRALSLSTASLLAYSAAAVWGLVAVIIEQQAGALPGARASAGVAAALLAVLCLHGAWLLRSGASRASPAT